MSSINYREFYRELFAPLESSIGPINPAALMPIIGFDCGGPLSFCTIDSTGSDAVTTYVSCELAVRKEQKPCEVGRYELLATCDDEKWVRLVLTKIGRMSLETVFGNHHTLDITSWVGQKAMLSGILLEALSVVSIEGTGYGILRCVGITRAEMDFKRSHGADKLIEKLSLAGIYPKTLVNRKSVV